MERLSSLAFVCGLACMGAALGCAAPVGAETDAGSTARLALVEVRASHAVTTGALTRLDASARFVSVKEPGAPSDALDLLGLGFHSTAPGTCVVPTDETRSVSGFRVDLRDLSPVSLELRGDDGLATPLPLEPRAFPDVVGLVSGVVFVAPASQTVESAKSVALQVSGTSFAGFELPDVPSNIELGHAYPDGTATVDARGFDLKTLAPKGDDRIAVDVVRSGLVRARCTVDANGQLHVDGATLGGLGDATLVLRAQRRVLRDDAVLGAIEARLERDVEVHVIAR